MESAFPSSFESGRDRAATRVGSWRLGIPTYIYAVVFSSFCILMGLLWDIMWHMSIGRDGLLAPPHVVIYVGAVVSGLFSAYQILSLTLTKNHPGRAQSVPFWGVFYSPLGAMFCVWGALAMLTSAPFDDWWHNTYGLDVQILTPPHTILAIGIMTVQFGAIVGVLALQNKYRNPGQSLHASIEATQRGVRLKWLFAISAGLLLTMLYTLLSESLGMRESHESGFYATAGIILPFYLLAVGRASLLRWPITTITAMYMLSMLVPSWVLQYFPATPRLGPVLNPITHYQPFVFPLVLILPGLALDWLMHRFEAPAGGKRKLNDWILSVIYAVGFMVILLVVQWPFGEFLLTSPYAHNGIFLSYSWTYDSPPDWEYRYAFAPWNTQSAADFGLGFAKALVYATLSTRVGLLWGNWMKRVVR
ncbi:hypothetical protein [Spirosoma sp.]|uniref:hypothetical protein n=1 Tax=Spirosoma sp. TaxID=1899569 RepID=UPI00263760C9|nr:hypothetical protein [Spirosoma sp.]MCX6214665.1 hypothetical protein [Spirosoma sp.]